jgi:hypothetical protein
VKIYPLAMSFAASGPYPITIDVSPEGWTFVSDLMAQRFRELPVAERLELRKQFEAQVALAKKPKRAQT